MIVSLLSKKSIQNTCVPPHPHGQRTMANLGKLVRSHDKGDIETLYEEVSDYLLDIQQRLRGKCTFQRSNASFVRYLGFEVNGSIDPDTSTDIGSTYPGSEIMARGGRNYLLIPTKHCEEAEPPSALQSFYKRCCLYTMPALYFCTFSTLAFVTAKIYL